MVEGGVGTDIRPETYALHLNKQQNTKNFTRQAKSKKQKPS
jgi:hypothetical protein